MLLIGTHGSERDEFEIAATGRPYLLGIFGVGQSNGLGRITFSHYNQKLSVVAPVGVEA